MAFLHTGVQSLQCGHYLIKSSDWVSVCLPQLSFIKGSLSHKENLFGKSQDIAVNVFSVLCHLKWRITYQTPVILPSLSKAELKIWLSRFWQHGVSWKALKIQPIHSPHFRVQLRDLRCDLLLLIHTPSVISREWKVPPEDEATFLLNVLPQNM